MGNARSVLTVMGLMVVAGIGALVLLILIVPFMPKQEPQQAQAQRPRSLGTVEHWGEDRDWVRLEYRNDSKETFDFVVLECQCWDRDAMVNSARTVLSSLDRGPIVPGFGGIARVKLEGRPGTATRRHCFVAAAR